MKVIHLSYSNFIGGASIAASRIHHALIKQNIDSRMWVNETNVQQRNNFQFNIKLNNFFIKTRRFITWPLLKTLSTDIPIHHSISLLPSKWVKKINDSDVDIVHLHWVHREMLSIKNISEIKKPIVWTLHDMWAFCGAEHYTNNFRWREGYQFDNRPNYEIGFDLNRWTWERKKKYWKDPIKIVTPSKWLAKCVSESALMSNWPVSVIANPIDVDFWKPLDKMSARDRFNLPKHTPLLLFGAIGGSKDPRKGFDLLMEALSFIEKNLQIKDLEIVVFGEKSPKSEIKTNFLIHYMGHLKEKADLLNLYNAADAVVIPSRQDNLPNIAVESLSCSLPIVAFNTGGLVDLVDHQKTGYIAKSFDVKDLAKGIKWVLTNNENKKLMINARKKAIKEFSYNNISKKYKDLYKKIINK